MPLGGTPLVVAPWKPSPELLGEGGAQPLKKRSLLFGRKASAPPKAPAPTRPPPKPKAPTKDGEMDDDDFEAYVAALERTHAANGAAAEAEGASPS